jgi:uncharacterized membrane-anchored protein
MYRKTLQNTFKKLSIVISILVILTVSVTLQNTSRRYRDRVYGENIIQDVTVGEAMTFSRSIGFTPYINSTIDS